VLVWHGGNWLLDEFLFRNPAFAIQAIEIETDGILPNAQLRACTGVKLGDNLLALDLSRIQRDLEYLPWIESAAVRTCPPEHTQDPGDGTRADRPDQPVRTGRFRRQAAAGGVLLRSRGHVMLRWTRTGLRRRCFVLTAFPC